MVKIGSLLNTYMMRSPYALDLDGCTDVLLGPEFLEYLILFESVENHAEALHQPFKAAADFPDLLQSTL